MGQFLACLLLLQFPLLAVSLANTGTESQMYSSDPEEEDHRLRDAQIEAMRAHTHMLVHLTRADCRYLLVEHEGDPSVEHKDGTDGHGKPVVPATIPGGNNYGLGDSTVIPLQIPLTKLAPTGLFTGPNANPYAKDVIQDSSAYPGVMVVNKDGSATINGQSIGDEGQDFLRDACREKFGMM